MTRAALVLLIVSSVVQPASGVAPTGTSGLPEGLQVATGPAARQNILTSTATPRAQQTAWSAFVNREGTEWQAIWDQTTGVPSRIFGIGIPAPGAVASPDIAARVTADLLQRHIALLAPGSSLSDFDLVSNIEHSGLRVVGYLQTHRDLRVIGGQVSFRIKNDRVFVLASEALPFVSARGQGSRRIDDHDASTAATRWIKDSAQGVSVRSVGATAVLPIVAPSGVREFRTVVAVDVDSTSPRARWRVYVDAIGGDVVAREQLLRFASGQVFYNAPLRHARGDRAPFPAQNASLVVDGSPAESDIEGTVSWDGDAATQVEASVVGPLVAVSSAAGSAAASVLDLLPAETVTWNESSDEFADAQVTTFIHTRIVKDYARKFNPELSWLDGQQEANVNIDDSCNAFSDGDSINFFQSSQDCANTGRLADVVYHEFGHSLHAHSIIEGVGAFDGAFSEGLSDYLAATITDDPAMGRGFFKSEAPLRHIDPSDGENSWPDDIGGVHFTGLIFAGAAWDLRTHLVERLGEDDGVALADRLYYAAVQRAANIPSTYVEYLAEDDDDGDLSNGTPNICDINAAFGRHGLRVVEANIEAPTVETPAKDGYEVRMRVTGLFKQCPGDSVGTASILWQLRDNPDSAEQIEMESSEKDLVGVIPAAADGAVIQYKVRVVFADGTSRDFPDNAADPYYELYIGELVELYCTDFETDPFANGWTHTLAEGEPGEGADDWAWGPLRGDPSSGDPPAPFVGDSVIGNDLGGGEFNGQYQADKTNYAQTPAVEVGEYSDVRLHYRRWLHVEDAFFDQATIYNNNTQVWQNFNSDSGNSSSLHHQDREWRFHDVALSDTARDGLVQVKFEIKSDGGLEFAGWTIDDFCIVANAASICGDGVVTASEDCDDGDANSDDEPGACRTNCQLAVCGDGIIDKGESCDDGNSENGDGCPSDCRTPGSNQADCGCRVGERDQIPPFAPLVLLVGAVLLLRRRRR